MISHGKDIKVFSGNSNPKLADAICLSIFPPFFKQYSRKSDFTHYGKF